MAFACKRHGTINPPFSISTNDLLAQLNPDDFWQVYRSIIVNVHRIVSIRRDTMSHMQLTLKDCDAKVPVGRAFEHLFKHM
jgi:DNA-binding LytR/AlgR family response regulator